MTPLAVFPNLSSSLSSGLSRRDDHRLHLPMLIVRVDSLQFLTVWRLPLWRGT